MFIYSHPAAQYHRLLIAEDLPCPSSPLSYKGDYYLNRGVACGQARQPLFKILPLTDQPDKAIYVDKEVG